MSAIKMAEKTIIKLNRNPEGFGEVADVLEKNMFSSALPKQCTHSYYEDEEIGLYVGVWDTTDMIESAAPYSCDEFMTLIDGVAEIKNSQTGEVETVTAGESFVIPQGYDCQWHQKGYLRKFYVIYEPPEEEIPASPVFESIIYIDEKNMPPWQDTSDGYKKKLQYQSHNQKFISGVWQGEDFNTDVMTSSHNEFMFIKDGCLICTDAQGLTQKINAGEALFVPQGASCSWQAQGKVNIHFVQLNESR